MSIFKLGIAIHVYSLVKPNHHSGELLSMLTRAEKKATGRVEKKKRNLVVREQGKVKKKDRGRLKHWLKYFQIDLLCFQSRG